MSWCTEKSPSNPTQSMPIFPSLLPSPLSGPCQQPSPSSENSLPSTLSFSQSILSAPISSSAPSSTPTDSVAQGATAIIVTLQGNATEDFPMQSTEQDLNTIPPAATDNGDPHGHHEMTEPNFSATRPCRGCSPVIEISATGWLDNPAEGQHGSSAQATTKEPVRATISISSPNIVISQEPSGGHLDGKTSKIIPTLGGIYTTAVPAPLTFHNHVCTINPAGYIVMGPGTTLIPGGSPTTIDDTTLSLEPSATFMIVQEVTERMQAATTVVTLTRSAIAEESGGGDGGWVGVFGTCSGDGYAYPTGDLISAGAMRVHNIIPNGWVGSVLLLVWCGVGCLAIHL